MKCYLKFCEIIDRNIWFVIKGITLQKYERSIYIKSTIFENLSMFLREIYYCLTEFYSPISKSLKIVVEGVEYNNKKEETRFCEICSYFVKCFTYYNSIDTVGNVLYEYCIPYRPGEETI